MNWRIQVLISLVVLSALHGCSTYREERGTRNYAEEMLSRVEYAPPAIYVDEPQETQPAIPILEEPAWLEDRASVAFRDTAFSVVVQSIEHGRFSNAYTIDMDPNHKISVTANGSVRDVIRAVENASNYVAQITDTGVRWSGYQVEVFQIDAFPGSYEFLQGKSAATAGQGGGSVTGGGTGGGGGGATGQAAGGLYDVDSAQYSNQKLINSDTMQGVQLALKAIVGDRGAVSTVPAAGMVMVKTTPDIMEQVRDYMFAFEKSTAQILLELKIIRLTKRSNSAWGLDWSLVRETSANLLTFDGQIPTTNLFGGIPAVIGATRIGSGTSVGSEIFLNILDRYADVTVVHEQRVLTTANRMYEIESGNIRPFLANSEIQTGGLDGLTVASGELSQVRDGFSLYAITKPVGREGVLIALSNRLSDITEIQSFELFGTRLEGPVVEDSRINITNKVKSGHTLIVASFSQNKTRGEGESPFSARFLPTYRGSEVDSAEYLVMVTPRIVDTYSDSWK